MDKVIKKIRETIIDMTGSDNFFDAVVYFEEERHKPKKLPMTQVVYDELNKSQVAVLFKILIDVGYIGFKKKKKNVLAKNSKSSKTEMEGNK